MSTSTLPMRHLNSTKTPTRKPHPIRRTTLLVGAAVASGITVIAALAHAAGVPLAVGGETIPLMGFAQLTFVGAVLGGLLAALCNQRSWSSRSFITTTLALTVLSCVPSVGLPPDTATKVTLVAAHLFAASIIIPTLARRIAR